ncbi:MAG: phage portal protein [Patescibacteria group bacterium]|nr:phage portal protein [Patescibacteria group bacterium]
MPPASVKTLQKGLDEAQAAYSAARRSRFRRLRTGTLAMGSGADYHYAIPTDYLRIIEDARDMDRNDAIVGTIVDRAVTNLVQDGMAVEPQTGDDGANAELAARWKDWSENADQCDIQQEHSYIEMEALACRHMLVDGDILGLLTEEGAVQQIEGHRPRTPSNTRRNCVHGVLLDERRRRIEYWLTKDNVSPLSQVSRVADIEAYPTRDPDGNRIISHLYNAKRVSQTRGVSVFAPIFDFLGMFEDINFAALVKQQITNCFVVFRELDAAAPLDGPPGQIGGRWTEPEYDGSTRTIEGLSPGLQIPGRRGEKLTGFTPNVPGETFFNHMHHILTVLSINLGLPLVVALMDASETNFSGFRGAVDQARMGWKRNQASIISRWHKPIYEWQVRRWLADDAALRKIYGSGANVFGHRWEAPRWPYIDPLKDASSDLLRQRNALASPSRIQQEHGDNWDTTTSEIVRDNGMAIRKAKKEAADINREFPDDPPVQWRELMSLPTPDGVQVSLQGTDDVTAAGNNVKGQSAGTPKKGNAA